MTIKPAQPDFSPYFAATDHCREIPTTEREMSSYARGLEEGREIADAQGKRLLAAAAERLEVQLTEAIETIDARFLAMESESASLALQFATLLTARTVTADVLVERTFRAALTDATAAPSITVMLNADLANALEPRLATLLAQQSIPARLNLVADPEMPPGDCRVVWQGGGLRRDAAALQARLAELIDHAFPAHAQQIPDPMEPTA